MTGQQMGRRTQQLLLAVSSLLLSIVLILLGLELALRLTYAKRISQERARQGVANGEERFWATYDADLGYKLTPGFGEVNDSGYLGRELGEKGERFRILLLGDSLGFDGDNAGDTYVGRLESALASDSDLVPLEVVNASVSGYTNYQELLYLRKFGLDFEPDLVGVGFVLNDLHRFLQSFQVEDGRIIGEGHAFTQEAEQGIGHPLFRLARKSRALLWLKDRFSILGSAAELASPGGYTFEYRPDFASAWQSESWGPIEEQLGEMAQLADEHGFKLFVHLFPYAQQLRSDYLERDREYVLEPQRRLRTICKRLAIPFLDLTPHLALDRHFLEDDVHLTREGRQVVAERLSLFLREARLVPQPESESDSTQ